jgi:hypothetical protein
MKTNLYSECVRPTLIMAFLLLIQLSWNTVLFASSDHKISIRTIEQATSTIIKGPSIQTTEEGVEIIESATGTIIN